jgi:ATP-binding cassette subfamily B protein
MVRTLAELPVLRALPQDLRDTMIAMFEPASFGFGEAILHPDRPDDGLFVLVSGRARVLRVVDGREVALATLSPGESFGRNRLADRADGIDLVRASTDVEVAHLDGAAYGRLVHEHPDFAALIEKHGLERRIRAFLHHHTPFGALPSTALDAVARHADSIELADGSVVLHPGDPATHVFVVQDGRCIVSSRIAGVERSTQLRRGEIAGDTAHGNAAVATVTTASRCTIIRVPVATFTALLAAYPAFEAAVRHDNARRQPIDPDRRPLDVAAALSNGNGATVAAGRETSVDPPFADEQGRFVKSNRRIRRFPHVWQIDQVDCGAACLAIVARHFGRAISPARIRQVMHLGLDGASLSQICRGASEFGLAARPVKASPRNLDLMPMPAIVHWRGNHWVVLYDVTKNAVRISDPARGRRRLERDEFEEEWTGYAALFEYVPEFTHRPGRRVGSRWLTAFFRPFSGLLARSVVLALLAAGLQMSMPVFTQVIVDRVLIQRDVGLLDLIVLAMFAVIAFILAATLLQRDLLSFIAVRIDSHALDFLTRRLLSLPMRYFDSRRTGDIQRRLAGMWQIREFFVEHGVTALTSITQLVAAVVLMLLYSPLLTVVFLAVTPLHLVLVRYASAWLYPLYGRLEEAYASYQSFQIDAIKGIQTVKSLAAEPAFASLMLGEFNSVARRRFRADFLVMSYHGLTHAVTLVSIVLFLAVGSRLVMNGTLSIGGLVAFNALVALANGPILALLQVWDNAQFAAVSLDRLEDVITHEPEQGHDRDRLVPVGSLEGRISVRDLGFTYDPDARPVLSGISFDVWPGARIAIVGRSGCGKTTLIKCLAGLLEPTAGSVLYDGLDLRTLNHRDLRRNIGMVLQEAHLFDDTISRNVAFGEDEPDLDAVRRSIELANAREFVERLPLAYETRIGESGLMLSAGQRQRIAIARALYHRPPIVIFDEATSALDTESERVLQDNMDRMLEGRTAIVIAHRLSTVRDADLILVLDQGRVAERGTHDELIERQGLYHFMCSRQLDV